MGKNQGNGRERSRKESLRVILTREFYRTLAFYGWTPRQADDLTLSELANAWATMMVLRLDRMVDMAYAVRTGMAEKGTDFDNIVGQWQI